jgi:hypothetical protein
LFLLLFSFTRAPQERNREVERECERQTVINNAVAKQIDTAVRERQVLLQNTAAKKDQISQKDMAVLLAKGTLASMESELVGNKAALVERKKAIEKVKLDKEAYAEELKRKELQTAGVLEEISTIELEITKRQTAIVELESKLRVQQVSN